MKTYLLTWNPKLWQWTSLAGACERLASGTAVRGRWSSGNSQSIAVGSRVFLLRQGSNQPGVIGRGRVTRRSYQDRHWRDKRRLAWYVGIQWDELLDPELGEVLPTNALSRGALSGGLWRIQTSGVQIPEEKARKLEAQWMQHLRGLGLKSNPTYRVEDYVRALTAVGPTPQQKKMIAAHGRAAGGVITLEKLGRASGYGAEVMDSGLEGIAMRQYGVLAAKVARELGFGNRVKTRVFGDDSRNDAGVFIWTMHPIVREALRRLGWIKGLKPTRGAAPARKPSLYPDEVMPHTGFFEGRVKTVRVNAYERDPRARRRCIDHYRARCTVCAMDFGAVYGQAMKDFIHVHHLKPISKGKEERTVDPVRDLRPVCPNCHAVIHSCDPPLTVEAVKKLRVKAARRGA
jgi:5-methylcytosine-specific restriction enzyme A